MEVNRDFDGSRVPQFIAGVAATFGGFTAGNVIGWSSPCLPLIEKKLVEENGLNNTDEFDRTQKEINSFISGIMNLGAAYGLIIVAFLVDRIGRKWTMIGSIPICAAGYLILALVENNIGWLIGRFMTGMSTGMFCVVSPMYACEIAQKTIRGDLGMSFQLNIVVGIFISYSLVYIDNYMWINLILIIPVVLFLVTIIFMPETPYFLLAKGRDTQARKALQWLRGKKTDIEQEFEFIKSEVLDQLAHKGNFLDLFRNKPTCKALSTAMILMFGQQLSGINAVMFYMIRIFRAADLKVEPELLSIIVAIVQIGATIISAGVVDLAGRRIMLLVSFGLMSLCLGSLGTYFYGIKLKANLEKWRWVPITSLGLFIVGYSQGAGPVPFLLLGEVLPGEVRGVAMCLCLITNWLLAFIVTKTFPNIADFLGPHWAFWLYALISVALLVLIALFIVETKTQTFTQIREVFEGKAPERAPIGLRKWPTPAEQRAEISGFLSFSPPSERS